MAEVSRAELIRMMVGRELSAVFPKVAAEPGEVVLEAAGWAAAASGVRDIDLERPRRRDRRAWRGWSARGGPSWRGSCSA